MERGKPIFLEDYPLRPQGSLALGGQFGQYGGVEYILGLGSNLGDREGYLAAALAELSGLGKVEVSSVYESKALVEDGDISPDFLNLAAILDTSLSPKELLASCLRIEANLGRQRKRRWEPRVIDIDLLAAGTLILSLDELIIPHPELHRRSFALLPLAELRPHWVHPVFGKTAYQLLGSTVLCQAEKKSLASLGRWVRTMEAPFVTEIRDVN